MMKTIQTSAQLKQSNRKRVVEFFLKNTVATKALLAGRTGLSVASCTSLLAELIHDGVVTELPLSPPKGGRPARRFTLNADYRHLLCLYAACVGEEYRLSYQVRDLRGRVLEEEDRRMRRLTPKTLEALCAEVCSRCSGIGAVGIGFPGIHEGGTILSCDIPSLAGIPLGKRLARMLGVPVFPGNDMFFTSRGFHALPSRRETDVFSVMLWPEDNFPGSSTVMNGRVLDGFSHFAGEVAWLPFEEWHGRKKPVYRSRTDLLEMIGKTGACLAVMVNPGVVFFAGDALETVSAGEISAAMQRYIPEKHMPEVVLRRSIHDEYMLGIGAVLTAQVLGVGELV